MQPPALGQAGLWLLMQQMQVHLCTFYRQEELANQARRGRRRVEAFPTRTRGFRQGASRAAGSFVQLRPAIIRARNSWIGSHVVPRSSNAARGQRQMRSARLLLKRICWRDRSLRAAFARGSLCSAGAFEIRCFARRRPDKSQQEHGLRRRCDSTHRSAAGIRNTGEATPERTMIERVQCGSIERGGSNLFNGGKAASPAGTEQKLAIAREVVEPALCTVEGGGLVDLRRKCDSALIRKAKLFAATCRRPWPFVVSLQRSDASAPQGGRSCVASSSSMTTFIPALRYASGLSGGLRVAIADGGRDGLGSARTMNVRPDDRRYLHAEHARLRIDQDISAAARPTPPADRHFRLRFFRPRKRTIPVAYDGAQPRRDEVSAQAFPADDAAQRDR